MEKSRSSIFSFNTLSFSEARLPLAALLAILAIGSVEMGLHLFEKKLPEPVLWGSGETPVKIAQVEAMTEQEKRDINVLIIGPSHASIGISPQSMSDQPHNSGISAYNGGLNGRTYSVVQFVLENVYLKELEPKVVVMTASPLILNENNLWMERNSQEFFSAPMPRSLKANGIARKWNLWLIENVFLYKYRKRETGLTNGFLDSRQIVDSYGYHEVKGTFDDQARDKLNNPEHPYQSIMDSFDFGGPSADGFESILIELKKKAIPVVVINMPFREEFIQISPTGRDDYQSYLEELAKLQELYGFIYYDYQTEVPLSDDHFKDVDHLNTAGAAIVSTRLARDLVNEFPVLQERQ